MLLALLLLTCGLAIAIRQSNVQTWLTGKIASYLTEKLGAKVNIESVNIDFFKTLVLEGVFVEDLHKDTLLYSKAIKADIDLLSFRNNSLGFGSISLADLDFNLKYYQGEEHTNLQFIIDYFSGNDTTAGAPWELKAGQVKLENARFRFFNQHMPPQEFGVNYFDIDARDINLDIHNISFAGDTIFAEIKHLSLIEKSGFKLNDFSAGVVLSPRDIDLENLKVATRESNITAMFGFAYEQWADWLDFNHKVSMRSAFQPSVIDFADIAYFAPYLQGMQKKVSVNGNIRGTVDHLKAKNLDLAFGNSTHFIGDININGLPNIDETYLHLSVKHLTTTKGDIDQIPLPPFNQGDMVETPANFNLLGMIRFKGDFSGFFNDFVAYGDFNTNLGKISSDIALSFDSISNKTYYKGQLSTQNFDAGRFFDVKEMGSISLNARIIGNGFTRDELKAELKGNVQRFEVYNYHYKNINVAGKIANRLFEGSLGIEDENLDLSFDGSVDFTGKLPMFNFQSDIRTANLSRLKLIDRDSTSNLAAKVAINLVGDKLDNMEGSVDLHNIYYSEKELSYYVGKINLASDIEGQVKTLKLGSDLADAKIKGTFNIEYLASSLNDLLNHSISASRNLPLKTPRDKIQDFSFDANLKNLKPLTELFLPSLNLDPNSMVAGSFNSSEHKLVLKVASPNMELNGANFKDFFLKANTDGNTVSLALGAESLHLTDSLHIHHFNIDTRTKNDTMKFTVNWNNHDTVKNQADIKGSVAFASMSSFRVEFQPSEVYISDSLWNLAENNFILVDSNRVTFSKLYLSAGGQEIGLNGVISDNPRESLKLQFRDFNLENFNAFSNFTSTYFFGTMNGDANFSQLFQDLHFSSSLNLKEFRINGEAVGDGYISSSYNTREKGINLNGRFFRGTIPTIEFTGHYYPQNRKNNIDINLKLEKLQLQMIDKWVNEWVTDIRGLASGEVSIKGELNKPRFKGRLSLQKTGCLVNFLNTHYTFSNDIMVDHDKFYFKDVTIFDSRGNKSNANGKVEHDNFKNFRLDIQLEPRNFMALNTQEHQNPLYFGTAYMSGKVSITGPMDKLNIDIAAKSEKGTVFNIPLTGTEEIRESNFITFINKDTTSVKVKDEYKVDVSGISMKFELDVTPDAEVLLIFDPKVGDIMKGRGHGHLSMEINTLGNFSIFGDYTIEEGDYLFTLMNVINKKFKVENGGTIKWSGDPYNAKLDMSAIYRLRTSLYDLGSDIDTTKRRVPVNVVLAMKNDLMKPDILFDINLPGSDEGTKTQLRTLLNNEQEMNQQVFALLSLNRFVPPLHQSSGQANFGGSGQYFSNSTEMLSNQLSNWLSQISKDFDIGLNYRPGDQISSREVEVALSTQLLNDRVVIDGNLGLPFNQQNQVVQNNHNLVGDFNMEYKISEDGRFRVKAFNRFNNYLLSTVNTPYTQGVGVFYRVEFNTFNELAQRYLNKFKRREKEQELLEQEKQRKRTRDEDDDYDFGEEKVRNIQEEIWQDE